MPKRTSKHEFVAAFSFAGEDRDVAHRIVKALKRRGYDPFYDQSHLARLWGKDDKEFEYIYGRGSRFVIPIISASYKDKPWPDREIGIALKEEKRRKEEFLLPIRLDDTPILGLKRSKFYLDFPLLGIRRTISIICKKLGPPPKAQKAPRGSRTVGRADFRSYLSSLTSGQMKILGIVGSSLIPLPIAVMKDIFPKLDWTRHVSAFKNHKVLKDKGSGLVVPPHAMRVLLKNTADPTRYTRLWVNAFKPLVSYSDTALLLAMHYFHLGRNRDAVQIISSLAEALEDLEWIKIYLDVMCSIDREHALHDVEPRTRAYFYSAIAACYMRLQNHRASIKWSKKQLRFCQEHSEYLGSGLAHLNLGIAFWHLDAPIKAVRHYESAVSHARKSKNEFLLGRALNNLATTVMESDINRAEALIEESITLKRKTRDSKGLGPAYITLGNLAAAKSDYRAASLLYRRAVRQASRLQDHESLALALRNLGVAHRDLADYGVAIKYYRSSYSIAQKKGLQKAEVEALQGHALARIGLKHYKRAAAIFLKIRRLEAVQGNIVGEIIALHDAAAMRLEAGQERDARKLFGNCLRLARRARAEEYIYLCRLHSSFSWWDEDGSITTIVKLLRSSADDEQRRGNHRVAERLWEAYGSHLVDSGSATPGVIDYVVERRLASLAVTRSRPEKELRVLEDAFRWKEYIGDSDGALQAVTRLTRRASTLRKYEIRAAALDQRGVFLQEAGELRLAERDHHKALKLAIAKGFARIEENALNNLGELLRKTGREEASLELFENAERSARSRRDYSAEISISHNRALALDSMGETEEAERLLLALRDRARDHSLEDEYIRALHALANVAFSSGRDRIAESRYLKTVKELRLSKRWSQAIQVYRNFARCLQSTKDPREAVRLLRNAISLLEAKCSTYELEGEIARIFEDMEDWTSARSSWERGLNVAIEEGDTIFESEAVIAIEKASKNVMLSSIDEGTLNKEISQTIDDSRKAALLLKKVRVLLFNGREREAASVFNVCRGLAVTLQLGQVYTDLHVALGDHKWAQGSRHQYSALKAYLAALVESIDGIESFLEIGALICTRFFTLSPRRCLRRIDALYPRLERWLQTQATDSEDRAAVGKVLWPLRLVRRLALSSPTFHNLSAEHFTEALEEEIRGIS